MTLAAAVLSASAAFGQTPQTAAPTQNTQTAPAAQAAGPVPKAKVGLLSFLALREGIADLKARYQKLQAELAERD